MLERNTLEVKNTMRTNIITSEIGNSLKIRIEEEENNEIELTKDKLENTLRIEKVLDQTKLS